MIKISFNTNETSDGWGFMFRVDKEERTKLFPVYIAKEDNKKEWISFMPEIANKMTEFINS